MKEIELDLKSKIPIYIQIRDQLKLKIATGELKQGAQVMPVRDLAQMLLINPNTVAKAYHELEHDGYIHTQRGMGTFVSNRAEKISKFVIDDEVDKVVRGIVRQLTDLGMSKEMIRKKVEEILSGPEE